MFRWKALTAASLIAMCVDASAFAGELPVTKQWAVNPNSEAGSELKISSKYKVKSYQVLVRDDSNEWTENIDALGWCKFTTKYGEFTDDGGFKIGASVYNWSGDRIRSVKIVALVE